MLLLVAFPTPVEVSISTHRLKQKPTVRPSCLIRAVCFLLSDLTLTATSKAQLSPGAGVAAATLTSSGLPPPPPSSAAPPLLPLAGGDTEDDEGMKHLQQVVEKFDSPMSVILEGKEMVNVSVCVFRRRRRW